MPGSARFVGNAVDDRNELRKVMLVGDIELYHLNPPLRGYSVVAAEQRIWAVRVPVPGDPMPPEDPVSTRLYGVSGGEGAQVEWHNILHQADGRNIVRTLMEAGYRVVYSADQESDEGLGER